MVAPIASGHTGRPVTLRAAQRGTGQGEKSLVRPDPKYLAERTL